MNGNTLRVDRTELLYVTLALLGLAGTWAQVWGYLGHGFVQGNVLFWREAVANPAGTFLTVDVLVLGAALLAWLFGEGRRLGVGTGWLWGYFLLSAFVAISFALPLFLAQRHRRLRLRHPDAIAPPAALDWVPIGVVAVVAVIAVLYSLGRPA